jgi:hypothetical protein
MFNLLASLIKKKENKNKIVSLYIKQIAKVKKKEKNK